LSPIGVTCTDDDNASECEEIEMTLHTASSPRPRRLGLALVAATVSALVLAEPALAAPKPAGGAALDQVIGATAAAVVISALLLWAIARHRSGKTRLLARAADFCGRVGGLPGWAALPSLLVTVSLITALLGMYWDISLHIAQGRDEGPLANPAHYLILAGLFGVFAAGVLAMSLPVGERPGPAAVRLGPNWYAPVGGVLIAAAGAFALLGFPLDDIWHRLFGQDVTLWGPTHLMLIGGAGMTLIGQALLLSEANRARRAQSERAGEPAEPDRLMQAGIQVRRIAVMGALLIGLSTFQGEFDFGVPQFQEIFHPMLISIAAGMALVAARIWIGVGGALGAAVFFLAIRGWVSLMVGPVFGEPMPVLPLYLGSALAVEAAGLALGRHRPLALGAVSGFLVGTVGFASEWGWSHLVMPFPWTAELLPEGLVVSVVAGVAGGLVGGLMAAGLRGELPRPAVSRIAFGGSLAAVAVLVGVGLATSQPGGVSATVTLDETSPPPQREALATVQLHPADAAADAKWLNITSWQGGGLALDRLRQVEPGIYRSSRPVPLYGNWKTLVRLHRDNTLMGVPIFLPADVAIPVPEVPAEPEFTRPATSEETILQRELRRDVPPSLFTIATLVVLAIALAFVAALAWGVARIARSERSSETTPPSPRRESRPAATPGGLGPATGS